MILHNQLTSVVTAYDCHSQAASVAASRLWTDNGVSSVSSSLIVGLFASYNRLLLDEDAVTGTLQTKVLTRWGSRRLFERLTTLGAVRELSSKVSWPCCRRDQPGHPSAFGSRRRRLRRFPDRTNFQRSCRYALAGKLLCHLKASEIRI